jgi:hypothetical protein
MLNAQGKEVVCYDIDQEDNDVVGFAPEIEKQTGKEEKGIFPFPSET